MVAKIQPQSAQASTPVIPKTGDGDANSCRIMLIAIPVLIALASFLLLPTKIAFVINAVVTVGAIAYAMQTKNTPSQPSSATESSSAAKNNRPITLNDVERIDVDPLCLKTNPSIHKCTILLKDGRKAHINHIFEFDMRSLTVNIPEVKFTGLNHLEDFGLYHPQNSPYSHLGEGFKPRSPEEILNEAFNPS